jgi:CRISPR/Cas system-associated endoribonuclease Cas2
MSKTVWNRYFFGLALITTLMLLVWIAGANAGAQTTTTGEWNANISSKDNSKINLNFERRSNKGHKNQMGQNYEFSELQGLSREQALSGGPVSFSLVREAGRIDCEGTFQNGKGSGTFRFTGNPAFVSAMKSRGFDFEPRSGDDDTDHWENKLFSATALNITTALADDLTSAFGKLQTEDLFKAAIFKVNSAFAREMKASGFENLGMEELVKARIFKIDADFVRQVSQMGFNKEPFESLVKMQIFKVTPEFITEVRNEGLNNVAVEELVKLRIFKIDSEFIRKVRSEGGSVDVESLVQRKIFARR